MLYFIYFVFYIFYIFCILYIKMPTLRLNQRRAQTVNVNLGPIGADLAYEESLINSGIASRAALIHQQVLEGQRLSLQNSRARQYT